MQSILRLVIKAPKLQQREGLPPYAHFNKFQVWGYPELCLAQAREALSYCDEESRSSQARHLLMHFGLNC